MLQKVVPGQMEQAFRVLRATRSSPFWPCAEPEVFRAYKKHTSLKREKCSTVKIGRVQ